MDGTEQRAALGALVAQRGESFAALSRLLGRNAAYLQQFMQRNSPRVLAEHDRRRLAAYLGVEEAALGGRSGAAAPALAMVPRMAVSASAGPGTLVEDDHALRGEWLDPAVLRRLGVRAADLSIIAARGDSMEPTIADGDELLINHASIKLTARGGIFALRRDGVVMVKRLALGKGFVQIISDNPAYPMVEAGGVDVVGQVVRLSRSLK